ncbi:MAG: hypothetical protein JWQ27_657 [Ferruginibacter sp.]|nr:hypothetical protein [Ferruginibacter sp.]
MKLSPTYKGLIVGALMIIVSLLIYKFRGNFDNNLQYIAYFLYIAGIVWTLVDFHRNPAGDQSFKHYFSQGFKCFIVITLLMVAFTYIFLKMNPSFREEMGNNYRNELVKKGNYTPQEIDTMVLKAKDYFVTMLTSMAIFSYLVIGGLVTLIVSGVLSQQKRN